MDVDDVDIASLPTAKVLGSVKKQKVGDAHTEIWLMAKRRLMSLTLLGIFLGDEGKQGSERRGRAAGEGSRGGRQATEEGSPAQATAEGHSALLGTDRTTWRRL